MACVLIQEQVELCGAQAVAERLQEEEYQVRYWPETRRDVQRVY